MLAKLRCARCGSPMCRVKAGTYGQYLYYRCFGSGAQRKGCGNLTDYDDTEQVVYAWTTLTQNEPHQTREWVEGQNWDDQIFEVKQDLREAVDAERFADLAALQARLEELRSRESTPGHFEYNDTGMTKGQYFGELDEQCRREYLMAHDIRVEKRPNGIRLVVDDEDYGVIQLAHLTRGLRTDPFSPSVLQSEPGHRGPAGSAPSSPPA
jgi:hypothetical protein